MKPPIPKPKPRQPFIDPRHVSLSERLRRSWWVNATSSPVRWSPLLSFGPGEVLSRNHTEGGHTTLETASQ